MRSNFIAVGFICIFALVEFSQYAYANIYKTVHIDGQVTYSNVETPGSTKLELLDPRWEDVDKDKKLPTNESLYIDSTSVLRVGHTVKFWLMHIYSNGDDKKYLDIACDTRKYKILQAEKLTEKLKVNKNEALFIVPESDIEIVYFKLCNRS